MNIQLYKNHNICEHVDGPAKTLAFKDFRTDPLWSSVVEARSIHRSRAISTSRSRGVQSGLWTGGSAVRPKSAPGSARQGQDGRLRDGNESMKPAIRSLNARSFLRRLSIVRTEWITVV